MKNPKNPLKADPTRTVTLRRQFENEMVRRFARFRRKLISLVVDEDAFGLKQKDEPFVMNMKMASTQLNMTDPECLRRIRELQARLDPADVLELETEPHVTVRYGLTEQDPEAVRELVSNVFGGTFDEVEEQGAADSVYDLSKETSVRDQRVGSRGEHENSSALQVPSLSQVSLDEQVSNVFCSTGEGGGVDASCSPKGVYSSQKRSDDLFQSTSAILRQRGWDTQIQHAGSTSSSYIYVGRKNDQGGFTTEFKIRIANHPKPGWNRGGWIKELKTYDLRPKTAEASIKKILSERIAPGVVANFFSPVWMTLGRLSLFQHPDQDVLYLSVESQGLERLNAELSKLPHTDAHDDYVPHLTIAYLKPGTGWKYLADPSFLEWQSYAFTELTFSDRERRQTGITLNVFCPTGEGGGVDPSCSPGSSPVRAESQRLISEFPILGTIRPPKVKVVSGASVSVAGAIGLSQPDSHARYYGIYKHGLEEIEIADNGDRDVASAFRHEYGHHVQDSLPGHVDPNTGRRHSWQNTVRDYVGKDGKMVFGDYERSSHKELFAESFAHYTSPTYLRGNLPKPIERYFDLALRGQEITTNVRWAFRSSPDKIKEFLKWLEGNLRPILTDEATTEDDWWNKYVMAGFKKGAARSYDDMKKAGAIPKNNLPFYLGQKDEFLKSAFRQPESVEKVKLLAGRVYTELKGVTEAMSQNLTRTLTDGLTQGMNPRQIATNIVKDVNSIGIKRARLIARTEIIRAHAEGQLDSMERLGVKQLAVMVEWNTAGDDRVCKLCQPLEGIVVTIDEAKGLIPRHPQCRCAFVPANVGEDQSEQVRGAARIKKAITKSLVAGKPKRGKSKSSWAGANRKISSFRPKSRV